MKIDVSDKYFWFVFLELLCGFLASISWARTIPKGDNENHESYNVIHGIMISGGFFPVVFRSMLFTYGKELGKPSYITLMVTALCLYIIGGVIWLMDKGGAIRGVFAIIAGALLMVDLVLKSMGK